MASRKYKRFDVFWWVASAGPELWRFSTLGAKDIEQLGASHFRIKAHPFYTADEDLQLVLRRIDGLWVVNSDSFPESGDYPMDFALTEEGAVWTDAQDDEVMVIRAIL